MQKIKCIIIKIVLLFLIILIGFEALQIIHKNSLEKNETDIGRYEEKNNNEEIEEEKSTLSLIMVGDYLIHSSVYKDAAKNAGGVGYDFKPMLKYIKEKSSKFDLAYYNQETILGGTKLGVSDYPTFNSPQEAGDAMIDAGFNLVSLATNHTMDSGSKAVLSSREYWNKHQDVLAVRKL